MKYITFTCPNHLFDLTVPVDRLEWQRSKYVWLPCMLCGSKHRVKGGTA